MTEEKFEHGQSGRDVVKIGDTVHKALGENYDFTHSVLRHLTDRGFQYSPKILGIDDKGREIMTFIDGKPISYDSIPLELSEQAIKILREFHDLLIDFTPEMKGRTICHTDYAPWNVLQKNDEIVGIIDFDDLKVGERTEDLAYAIWTFLDLGSPDLKLSDSEQMVGILALLKAYGTDIVLSEFVDSLLSEQHRILRMRQRAAENAPSEKDKAYQISRVESIKHSISWVERNRTEINKQISLV